MVEEQERNAQISLEIVNDDAEILCDGSIDFSVAVGLCDIVEGGHALRKLYRE